MPLSHLEKWSSHNSSQCWHFPDCLINVFMPRKKDYMCLLSLFQSVVSTLPLPPSLSPSFHPHLFILAIYLLKGLSRFSCRVSPPCGLYACIPVGSCNLVLCPLHVLLLDPGAWSDSGSIFGCNTSQEVLCLSVRRPINVWDLSLCDVSGYRYSLPRFTISLRMAKWWPSNSIFLLHFLVGLLVKGNFFSPTL